MESIPTQLSDYAQELLVENPYIILHFDDSVEDKVYLH